MINSYLLSSLNWETEDFTSVSFYHGMCISQIWRYRWQAEEILPNTQERCAFWTHYILESHNKWVFSTPTNNNKGLIKVSFSTYEEVCIYANETRKELVSFHPAILSADDGKRMLASCVTFAPPHKVPPGSSHRVISFSTYPEEYNISFLFPLQDDNCSENNGERFILKYCACFYL